MSMEKVRGFEVVIKEHRHFENDVILPLRGSEKAAGYDFFSNETVSLKPNEKHIFWSDVKAYMLDDEVLKIFVRSSIGIKKDLRLCNQTGIIDPDYYSNPKNDGNIGICIKNTSEKVVTIFIEDAIAQGIFQKFLESDNGNTKVKRESGIGSTHK